MYFILFQDNLIKYVSDAIGVIRMPRKNWEGLALRDILFAHLLSDKLGFEDTVTIIMKAVA